MVWNYIIFFKSISVGSNGHISFGNALENSHTANSKSQGTNSSNGDFSPTGSWTVNGSLESAVSDQDQIANPSAPISNQV